jgi:hypothetical protein
MNLPIGPDKVQVPTTTAAAIEAAMHQEQHAIEDWLVSQGLTMENKVSYSVGVHYESGLGGRTYKLYHQNPDGEVRLVSSLTIRYGITEPEVN